LLDLASSLPFGAHLLALAVVAFLADLGHAFLRGSTFLFAAVATLLGTLVYGALLQLIIGGGWQQLAYVEVVRVAPTALYNLVALVPIFYLLRGLDRRLPLPVIPEW
jgi:cell shape-determining protein MreD